MGAIIMTTVLGLTGIAIYGLLTRRHLIRLVICFNVLEIAVLLAIVYAGFVEGGQAPIVGGAEAAYVSALPHAVALTAIVIAASSTALMLAYVVRIYRTRGSVRIERVRRWRG